MAPKGSKSAPKDKKRVAVPIEDDDLSKLRRWQLELERSEAYLTKRLLSYAIRNAKAAIGVSE